MFIGVKTPHESVVQYLLFRSYDQAQVGLELKKIRLDFTFTGNQLADAYAQMHASMPDDLRDWHQLGMRRPTQMPESSWRWMLDHGLTPFQQTLGVKSDQSDLVGAAFRRAYDLFESQIARCLIESLALSQHPHDLIIAVVEQLKVPIDIPSIEKYLLHYFNFVDFTDDELEAYVTTIEVAAGRSQHFAGEARAKRFALYNPLETHEILYRAGRSYNIPKETAVIAIRQISTMRALSYHRRELAAADLAFLDATNDGFDKMGKLVNTCALTEKILESDGKGDDNQALLALFLVDGKKQQLFDRAEEIAKGNYLPRSQPKLALPADMVKPKKSEN